MANETASARARPQFRNLSPGQLLSYRLPPAGVVSILHRVSGIVLFLMLPVLLWLFQLSLTSEGTYEHLRGLTGTVLAKLVLLGVIWALLHHLVAGIRYLALDLHVGIAKEPATRSAVAVFVVSLPLAAIAGLWLFGVI